MLFLFSDVGEDDAPTRIRVGSHLDVPAALAPAGDEGMSGAGASHTPLPLHHERVTIAAYIAATSSTVPRLAPRRIVHLR